MNVTLFSDDMLPGLTELINDHTRTIPPHWSFRPERVKQLLNGQSETIWQKRYGYAALPAPETLCVLDRGRILAAGAWYRLAPDDPDCQYARNTLFIRWLYASPEAGTAGLNLLLAEFRNRAERVGFNRIVYSGRDLFGIGLFGIPATWRHLIEPMIHAGYKPSQKTVHMASPATLSLDNKIANSRWRCQWTVDNEQREWKLEVFDSAGKIGECQVWGSAGCFDDPLEFPPWTMIEYIETAEENRRMGIGSFMVSKQWEYHSSRGIKGLVAQAVPDNQASIGLFKSLGFTIGPEAWEMVKED